MSDQSPHNSAPSEEIDSPVKESSIKFMLAEFKRIQVGEIYNRSSGESRVTLYITLLSLISAGLVALLKLTDLKDPTSVKSFYFISFIALLLASLVGTVSFKLLLERWRLTVIYLRKLARIRRWFLTKDQSLGRSLVYATDEAYPSFSSKRIMSSSLMTFVAVLNSVTIAASIMFLSVLVRPQLSALPVGILGAIAATVVWFAQRSFARRIMNRYDRDENAAFPPPQEGNLANS